jgi:hypothetical protein
MHQVDFKTLEKFLGWQHLRTYRRGLFCKLPIKSFIGSKGTWLERADDMSIHSNMTNLTSPEDISFIPEKLMYYRTLEGVHDHNNMEEQDREVAFIKALNVRDSEEELTKYIPRPPSRSRDLPKGIN